MADKKCDIVISTSGKWREDQVNTEALRCNLSKQTFERWNGSEWELLAPTFQKGELTESPPEGDVSYKIATTAWIADYVRAAIQEFIDTSGLIPWMTLSDEQIVYAEKNFSTGIILPSPDANDNTDSMVPTSWVQARRAEMDNKDSEHEQRVTSLTNRNTALENRDKKIQNDINTAYIVILAEYQKAGGKTS